MYDKFLLSTYVMDEDERALSWGHEYLHHDNFDNHQPHHGVYRYYWNQNTTASGKWRRGSEKNPYTKAMMCAMSGSVGMMCYKSYRPALHVAVSHTSCDVHPVVAMAL